MFSNAAAFNKYIGSWDVSSVTDMRYMFEDTIAFDKDVTVWNVCKVGTGNFVGMFINSPQSGTNLEPPNANGPCILCPAGTYSGSGMYVTGGNSCT